MTWFSQRMSKRFRRFSLFLQAWLFLARRSGQLLIYSLVTAIRTRLRSLVGILIASLAVVIVIIIVVQVLYPNPMSGFGQYVTASGDIRDEKTLWDWLEILIIPILVAMVVASIGHFSQQKERAIAARRTQETAIQSYLDYMTELLLEHSILQVDNNNPLNPFVPTQNIMLHHVARARTVTILRTLDGNQKGIILRFLHEAQLISPLIHSHNSFAGVVRLKGADLSEAMLDNAQLFNAVLTEANFQKASLRNTNLSNTHLDSADLSFADLQNAFLEGASFQGANLRGANLGGAFAYSSNLRGADLTLAKLRGARFYIDDTSRSWADTFDETTTLPDGTKFDPNKGVPQLDRFTYPEPKEFLFPDERWAREQKRRNRR